MKLHKVKMTDHETYIDDFKVCGIVEKNFEYTSPTISSTDGKVGHFGDGILTLKIRVTSAEILCDVFQNIVDSDLRNNIDGK